MVVEAEVVEVAGSIFLAISKINKVPHLHIISLCDTMLFSIKSVPVSTGTGNRAPLSGVTVPLSKRETMRPQHARKNTLKPSW